MAELNIFTGQRVGATGIVTELGSILVVPTEAFRALVGRELVFGDFVLQTLLRRRKAIEQLQMGIQIVGSRFDPETQRLREFSARNRLHHWLDADDPRARSVILALGVQYRRLPIPRLADYEGLGVAYATDSAREQLRPGDDAVVV